MSTDMHLSTDLAALGQILRADFQSAIAAVDADVIVTSAFLDEGSGELLDLEDAVQRLWRPLVDLLSLDAYLTSGFVPGGLAGPAAGADDQEEAGRSTASSWAAVPGAVPVAVPVAVPDPAPAAQQARTDRLAARQRQTWEQNAAVQPPLLAAQTPANALAAYASGASDGSQTSAVQAESVDLPTLPLPAAALPAGVATGFQQGQPAAFGSLRDLAQVLKDAPHSERPAQPLPAPQAESDGHEWEWQTDLPAPPSRPELDVSDAWPEAGDSLWGQRQAAAPAAARAAPGSGSGIQLPDAGDTGAWPETGAVPVQQLPARHAAAPAAASEGSPASPAAALLSPLQPETGQWETILDTLTREIAREYRRFYGA